jgi:hypothetical protein
VVNADFNMRLPVAQQAGDAARDRAVQRLLGSQVSLGDHPDDRAELAGHRERVDPAVAQRHCHVREWRVLSGGDYVRCHRVRRGGVHKVLVNLYYDPFDTSRHCLDHVGLDPAKEKSLLGLLHALNSVLADGAQAAGLSSVQPDFTGHALRDPGPYVQGLHDPAPFHPTPPGNWPSP